MRPVWRRRKPDSAALVNTPVQGGCADGIKAALIALASKLPAKSNIISTVHDEIIVECDQSDANEVSQILRTAMREEMEGIFPTVPIEVEVGAKVWQANFMVAVYL